MPFCDYDGTPHAYTRTDCGKAARQQVAGIQKEAAMGTNGGATIILRVGLDATYLARLQQEFPDVHFPLALDHDALMAALPTADAIVGGGSLTPEMLERAPNVRWVAATSAGVEGLLPALKEREGITLTNFSGVAAPNIAEHVLMLMFAFARGARVLVRQQEQHQWITDDVLLPTFELGGQTLGIVGMGAIGEELARKAHGIGMRVLGIQRHPAAKPKYLAELLASDDLPQVLTECDHLALCLPLTPATKYTIDRDELAHMKRTAYLYNIGRGALVNQDALIVALRGGVIAGAGLDVTTPEPLPPDSPLWEMPNVFVTGHTAASSPHYWERGIELLVDNIRRFLAGDELRDTVDTGAGY